MDLLFILFLVIVADARKRLSNSLQKSPATADNDDEIVRNVDVFAINQPLPVHFGHIGLEGHEDSTSDMKQPLDLLELHMKYPKNSEEEEQFIQNAEPGSIQWIEKEHDTVSNPRDEYIYRRDNKLMKDKKTSNDSDMQWFDLPHLQLENIVSPKKTAPKISKRFEEVATDLEKDVVEPVLRPQPRREQFVKKPYNQQTRKPRISRTINWTTCDEFGQGAKFHPNDIVGIEWVPFYIWCKNRFTEDYVHLFAFPKKQEVKFYKDTFGQHLNNTLDWDQPKLILKSDIEILLIAANKRGLFDSIVRIDIPDYVKHNKIQLPIYKIRLKTVGSYLAIMYCEENYAKIMAVSGAGPPTPGRKLAEAKILKFRGRGYAVSRNLEHEQQDAAYKRELEIAKESHKFIYVDGPVPPLDIEK